jgi:hypothetical protein
MWSYDNFLCFRWVQPGKQFSGRTLDAAFRHTAVQGPRAPGIDCRGGWGGGVIRRQSRTAAIGSARVFYFMFPSQVFTSGKRRVCCYLCAVHPCRYSEVRGTACCVCARNTQKWTPKGGRAACEKYYFSDGKRNHVTSLNCWMSTCLKQYSSA